jgi:hypothetical protein
MTQKIDQATQNMIKNLEEKYGKTVAQWTDVIRASGARKHGEIVSLLKTQHGMTHGYANTLAILAREAIEGAPLLGGQGNDDALVEAQFSGEKAGLRPVYDALLEAVQAFGKDVEVSPKKAYVSLRRGKQFAIVQATTAKRLDVGINLKGVEPQGRLEASGSFNAMVSHRVRVDNATQVDAELLGWLRKAYESS